VQEKLPAAWKPQGGHPPGHTGAKVQPRGAFPPLSELMMKRLATRCRN
jgi:hypothetical protein